MCLDICLPAPCAHAGHCAIPCGISVPHLHLCHSIGPPFHCLPYAPGACQLPDAPAWMDENGAEKSGHAFGVTASLCSNSTLSFYFRQTTSKTPSFPQLFIISVFVLIWSYRFYAFTS
jgi:hypothetical protein